MEKLTFRFLQRFESDFIKLGNLSRIAVAVSGGCDSVALLVLLKAFCEKKSIELAAFHVDHNLREDSQADANWVKALADKFKISFYQKKIAKPTESQLAERGVEDWARRVRYEAFSSMACEFGCKYIATGHTANDQTETYLIRLLRGTSIQGIKGIAPIKNLKIGENELFFWRPLLNSKRYELEEYLISIEKILPTSKKTISEIRFA
jgi:tRNA(Ile)-lysidine synthase